MLNSPASNSEAAASPTTGLARRAVCTERPSTTCSRATESPNRSVPVSAGVERLATARLRLAPLVANPKSQIPRALIQAEARSFEELLFHDARGCEANQEIAKRGA